MEQKILEFLSTHRVCSLTTLLKDGTPHAAAVHYSHNVEPLELFFSTDKTSKKCQDLLTGNSTKASVVVGFSEEEWKTLQMDGKLRAVAGTDELQHIHPLHYLKHPEAAKYKNDPDTIFLKFTPTWWRYSDYTTEPLTVIASDS